MATRPGGGRLIDPDLTEFLLGGRAMWMATATPGRPNATRCWGLTVDDDGRTVRVRLEAEPATAVSNLAANDRVAVAATQVDTYRSVQLKGRAVGISSRVTLEEDAVWARYLELFVEANKLFGLPDGAIARLLPPTCVVVTVEVAEVFDQTPGPDAGRPFAGWEVV